MRYMALACDFDGTIADSGGITKAARAALERLRPSGRRCILVTGRTFEELAPHCTGMELFDAVVLENGAVVYWPGARETETLCAPPPRSLAERLAERGVKPLVSGRVILATRRPHEATVLEAIRDLGLELYIVFNGRAVMVLPPGVNKAAGLKHALRRIGLSLHEVVGVGNAENDHSFLDICECSVAVANGVEAIKAKVDFTTHASGGAGVAELIDELVTTDLARRMPGGPGDVVVLATHVAQGTTRAGYAT